MRRIALASVLCLVAVACATAEAEESSTTSSSTSTTVAETTTTTVAPTTTTTLPPMTTTTRPTTTTTTQPEEISEETAQGFADSVCDAFETAYLYQIVEIAQEAAPGVSEEDTLVLIALSISASCPELTDMYLEEILEQYPEHMDYVADSLENVSG